MDDWIPIWWKWRTRKKLLGGAWTLLNYILFRNKRKHKLFVVTCFYLRSFLMQFTAENVI